MAATLLPFPLYHNSRITGTRRFKNLLAPRKPFDTPRGIPYTANHMMGPIRGVVRK